MNRAQDHKMRTADALVKIKEQELISKVNERKR